MKSIATLIRVKRWELDQKRRALADLELLHQELRERAQALEARLLVEQGAAHDDSLRFAYAAYARRAIEQREALAGSLHDLDQQIEAARDEVAELYGDVKRYERVSEINAAKIAAESRRRDTAVLDEVASLQHRRRSHGG